MNESINQSISLHLPGSSAEPDCGGCSRAWGCPEMNLPSHFLSACPDLPQPSMFPLSDPTTPHPAPKCENLPAALSETAQLLTLSHARHALTPPGPCLYCSCYLDHPLSLTHPANSCTSLKIPFKYFLPCKVELILQPLLAPHPLDIPTVRSVRRGLHAVTFTEYRKCSLNHCRMTNHLLHSCTNRPSQPDWSPLIAGAVVFIAMSLA